MWIGKGYVGWLAGVVVALAVRAAPAAPAAIQPAQDIPHRAIQVRPGSRVDLLGFSPDGKSLYLWWYGVARVNVWRVMVYYWPEGVGIALLGITLWRLRRILKRRRAAGEEYCRSCNYMLRGLIAERCPECGKSVAGNGRVKGGSWAFRVAVRTLAAGVVIAGYGFGYKRLPREGRFSGWFEWYSMELAQLGVKKDWIQRHLDYSDGIFVADLATGEVRRLCWIKGQKRESYFRPVISTDCRSIFAVAASYHNEGPLMDQQGVVQFDVPTGRMVHRYQELMVRYATVSPSARTLFLSRVGSVLAINAQSGKRMEEFQFPAGEDGVVLPHGVIADELALVSTRGPGVREKLRVWNGRTGEANSTFEVGTSDIITDGHSIYKISTQRTAAVVEIWNAITQRKIDSIRMAVASRDLSPAAIGGGILGLSGNVSGHGEGLLVVDLKRKKQIGFIPAPVIEFPWMISPDGGHAICGYPRKTPTSDMELRIYDLRRAASSLTDESK